MSAREDTASGPRLTRWARTGTNGLPWTWEPLARAVPTKVVLQCHLALHRRPPPLPTSPKPPEPLARTALLPTGVCPLIPSAPARPDSPAASPASPLLRHSPHTPATHHVLRVVRLVLRVCRHRPVELGDRRRRDRRCGGRARHPGRVLLLRVWLPAGRGAQDDVPGMLRRVGWKGDEDGDGWAE